MMTEPTEPVFCSKCGAPGIPMVPCENGCTFPVPAPGDVLLEIRHLPGLLIAWDPEGETEIARVHADEYTDESMAFRAALLALARAIGDNREYVEGGA